MTSLTVAEEKGLAVAGRDPACVGMAILEDDDEDEGEDEDEKGALEIPLPPVTFTDMNP